MMAFFTNFDFVLMCSLKEMNEICKMMDILRGKPVLFQSIIGITGIGAMFPLI